MSFFNAHRFQNCLRRNSLFLFFRFASFECLETHFELLIWTRRDHRSVGGNWKRFKKWWTTKLDRDQTEIYALHLWIARSHTSQEGYQRYTVGDRAIVITGIFKQPSSYAVQYSRRIFIFVVSVPSGLFIIVNNRRFVQLAQLSNFVEWFVKKMQKLISFRVFWNRGYFRLCISIPERRFLLNRHAKQSRVFQSNLWCICHAAFEDALHRFRSNQTPSGKTVEISSNWTWSSIRSPTSWFKSIGWASKSWISPISNWQTAKKKTWFLESSMGVPMN